MRRVVVPLPQYRATELASFVSVRLESRSCSSTPRRPHGALSGGVDLSRSTDLSLGVRKASGRARVSLLARDGKDAIEASRGYHLREQCGPFGRSMVDNPPFSEKAGESSHNFVAG